MIVVSDSFGPYQNLEAELIQSVDELIVFEKYLNRLYSDLPDAQLWMKESHHMFDLRRCPDAILRESRSQV